MTDLADRPNPSHWAELLDLALPILDEAFKTPSSDTVPSWTLGGGTAIALRLAHRISDDVDLFVGGSDLRLFIPQRNPSAAALGASMQFPGNYLKFQLKTGEIDFLPGPLLTDPGFTTERFRGRMIALQTSEEVILKKIRYRATSFKARDVFDLAAVAAHSATLGDAMVQETGDRLPTLLTAIRRHDERGFETANIRALPGHEPLFKTALASAERFVESLITSPGRKQKNKVKENQHPMPGTDAQAEGVGSDIGRSSAKTPTSKVRVPVTKMEIETAISRLKNPKGDTGKGSPEINENVVDLLLMAGDRMTFEIQTVGSAEPPKIHYGLDALSSLREGFGRGRYRTLSMAAEETGPAHDTEYRSLLDRAIGETQDRSTILFGRGDESTRNVSTDHGQKDDFDHGR